MWAKKINNQSLTHHLNGQFLCDYNIGHVSFILQVMVYSFFFISQSLWLYSHKWHRGHILKQHPSECVCVCGGGRGRDVERERREVRGQEKDRVSELLDAKFIWGWGRHPDELWVWHWTDNSLDEVLVAVAHVALWGQFGAGHAACQVHQILQGASVAHATVLDFIDRWKLWNWDQFFLWGRAET